MNTQTCLFEQDLHEAKIIQFPKTKKYVANYRKGGEQTVYPIKDKNDLKTVASWLAANADPKYLVAFVLGINLGLRANELLNLKKSDILDQNGNIRFVEDYRDTTDRVTVYQKKNHKNRHLYLNQACVNILTWYFDNHFCKGELLFPSREISRKTGKIEAIKPDTFRKVLKAATAACGIKLNIGTHTLRKTFGYQHYKEFHDIEHLQRLFGHSSPLITMRYIGVTEEDEKFAYNVMNLDVVDGLF